MAFKRGFCTHCHGDEKARIFNVNKDAEVCYCPSCTHAMTPKEAISNYSWLISFHLKKASKALFESTEYLLAYQTFAHVIDLDNTVKVAYFGRILSLVYLSTLRTSKINFALIMHRQQAKLCHYQETAREYFNFLWLLFDALEYYEAKMLKRLTSHSYFYDQECIELYLERLYETRQYKKYIAEEASFFIASNKEQFQVILDRATKADPEYDVILGQKFITAEGGSYAFAQYDENNKPVISLQEEVIVQMNRRFKPASLSPVDNKKLLIPDEIFMNNLPLSRLVAASIPVAIALLAIVIGGFIASFIVPDQTIKLLIYVFSALFLVASLLLVILHFSWKNRLKKKYYNGTNPFIFK